MKVLVVVATYNGAAWIQRCLASVKSSSHETRILVVDNGSTDNTTAIIRSSWPGVELIEPGSNLKFARANNIGLKLALERQVDHVFLLNQDAWMVGDCLDVLLQASMDDPAYGIVSPIHLNGSEQTLDWNFTGYVSDPATEGRQLYADLLLRQSLRRIYRVKYVNAAAWLIGLPCLQRVGVFDDLLFSHYGEDENYVQRVSYHGFSVGVSPHAFIAHDREERKGKASPAFLAPNLEGFKRRFLIQAANINISTDDVRDGALRDLLRSLAYLTMFRWRGAWMHLRLSLWKASVRKLVASQRESYRKLR